MASNLTVLAFDDMGTAETVHQALVRAKNQGLITIDDAAVVVKDEEGKIKVDNQVARGTWISSAVGGGLGLLIGSIFFPIGGLVLGLAGGALVAKSMDLGVDGKFVDQVSEKIQPGTSALFVLTQGGNEAAILALLREYEGHVIQTTLDSETEEAMKKALKDKD
ncbi:MAG: DUF1269 domain-containing protein [Candidatus Promineifilaceae bacterium]|jgi:uncharacterized membrane protein